MKKIFLWGGKAKAKIIQKMILNEESKDVEISIIYDPLIKELPFESSSKFISSPNELKLALADITHFIMCNGGEHGYARYKIANELKKLGLKPVDVISPHAILDDIKQKGEGLQAMPGAVVHKFSTIGDQCIINTNATPKTLNVFFNIDKLSMFSSFVFIFWFSPTNCCANCVL